MGFGGDMERLLEMLEEMEAIYDTRENGKTIHRMPEVLFALLAATLADMDDWAGVLVFIRSKLEVLKKFLPFEGGVPSANTIRRVLAMVPAKEILRVAVEAAQMANRKNDDGFKDILAWDGKTARSSGREGSVDPMHLMSVYSTADGLVLGQALCEAKADEALMMLGMLDEMDVAGTVSTADSLSTQPAIAEKITKKGGDYALAVKGNNKKLENDIAFTFQKCCLERQEADPLLDETGPLYRKTVEAGRGILDTREYWMTGDLSRIRDAGKWAGLAGVGKVTRTVMKAGVEKSETRLFILSFDGDASLFERAVRGHWGVETMHRYLDVTFKEDNDRTLNSKVAENLSALRKACLGLLKKYKPGSKTSMANKRKLVALTLEESLEEIFNLQDN
jgi:predicted transposase YbfD/YdcC